MIKKSLLLTLLLALLVPWAANAQTSLWSEDFEGGTMPAGWTTDGPGSWSVGVGDYSTSTGAGQGSYNALIKHGTTGNVTKLITPEIDLSTVASAELSFMHIQRSWSGDIDELRVYYRTSSSEAWTMLQEYTNAYGLWTTEEGIALPNPSSTYQIAFEHTDNYGYGLGIDAVSILPPATCPKPSGLNVALTPGDGTVATLSWTSDADAWQICLNGDETNLIPATTNPYTITGLTPETTYTAKVRTNCGSEQSDWSNVVTFTPTNAYQITVNDGTTTNGYVPIYGYYVDNITKSQFIIPAENLTDMAWGTINKMTFYAEADKNWGAAQFEVYMTETSETTLSALADYGTMTKVKNAGSLSISGKQMVVEFDTPYQYMGGNLMIGFLQTVSGTYSSCSWYGVSATGASMGGYGSSINQQNFLPKTTFDYEPGEEPACMRPTNLAVSNVTAHTANISWTSDGNAWQICVNDDEENLIDVAENTYTLTGLAPETAYTVKVRANCGDDGYSDWTDNVSFTTDVACPAPTGFAVAENGLTGHTATLNWQGTSNEYQVRYRTTAYIVGIEEGFNSDPEGWSYKTGALNADSTATLIDNTSWNRGTSNGVFDTHIYMNMYSSSVKNYWLITPSMEIQNGYALSFDMAYTAYNGTQAAPAPNSPTHRFAVLISTDDMQHWTILREWNNSGSEYVLDQVSTSGENSGNIDLSAYAGQTAYIAFFGHAEVTNYDNNFHFDNVAIGIAVPAGEMQYASNITEETVTLQGLLAETEYEAWLQGDCGSEGPSTEVGPISFTTDIACPTPTNLTTSNITANSANIAWTGNDDATGYNLRYRSIFLQGFESGMGDWTTIDADEDGYNWVLGSQAEVYIYSGNASGLGHNSSNDLIISGSYRNSSETSGEALNPDNYLVSPMINLGGTISFYAHGSNMSYVAEHFGVFVSTNSNNNPDDFVMVNEWTASTTEFIQYSADLSAYSGQGYVAIRHFNCTDQFLLSVDDITITEPEAVNPWTLIEDVTNPYTLTELTDNTSYEVQVQVVCGGEDGESAWVGTSLTTYAVDAVPFDLQADVMATAATLNWYGVQDSYNVRYRENPLYYFNPFNTEEDRAGWTFSKAIYGIEDPVYNLSETSNFVLAMGWETTAEDFIYSPALPAYPSGSTLEFYHFYLNEANTFQVGYSTTTNDATAFTWSNPIAATVSYQNGAYTVKYSQVLPDGVKYVAFKATAASQAASIFIDNFKIYNAAAIDVWEETVSNVNARTLEITGLTPETEYEWQVQGNMTNGTTEWSERAFFTTMDVIIWNNPDDWPNDSVPEAYSDVTIPANTLVIIPDGCIARPSNITFEENGSLTIEPGGQLVHDQDSVVATVVMDIIGYGDGLKNNYYLIASPLRDPISPMAVENMTNNVFDLYKFDQSNHNDENEYLEWVNYHGLINGSYPLVNTEGYLYANSDDVMPRFTGEVRRSDENVEVGLIYDDDIRVRFNGWNLVGNPFVCNAFVLTEQGQTVDFYEIVGDSLSLTTNNEIAPCQGIFVQAESDVQTVTFSRTAPAKRSGVLNMNLTQGRAKVDMARIRFGEGRNLGRLSFNDNSSKLYIPMDGKDYAVVYSEGMGEMPVSFKAESNGTYTLGFSNSEVSFSYLHLIDNMTGTDVDLLQTPNYSFEASTTDYASRFKLVFCTGNAMEDNFAFFSNGSFVINNEGEATLQVIDVTGRIVKSESINGSASVNVNAAAGVYMLRLINGNDVKVQKIVVK